MSDLADKKCIPCEGGIPSFNLEEIHKYLKKVDGWDVESIDNKDFYIIKNFTIAIVYEHIKSLPYTISSLKTIT